MDNQLKAYKKNIAGFTLLEVLIGIAVLTLGLVVSVQAFPFLLNLEREQTMQNTAVFLAQEKIEDKISQSYGSLVSELEQESALPAPFVGFSRSTAVFNINSSMATTTFETGLKEVRVWVSFRSPFKSRNQIFELASLIADK